MDKSKWEIYFHNLLGINWHMQTGGNVVRSGQQIKQNVQAGHVVQRLLWTTHGDFFKWSLPADGLRHRY